MGRLHWNKPCKIELGPIIGIRPLEDWHYFVSFKTPKPFSVRDGYYVTLFVFIGIGYCWHGLYRYYLVMENNHSIRPFHF